MAAGTFTLYNESKKSLFITWDWDADTHYAHLLKDAYVPAATHNNWADVSAQEVTDGDYGAILMAGETVVGGTATATAKIDANDVSYGTNVTITAEWLVVRVGTATPGTGDLLVGYVQLDTGGPVSSTNGTFQVQWHANGLFTAA